MVKGKNKSGFRNLFLFLLLTYIIGCVKVPSGLEVSPEVLLKERVTAYIVYRTNGEFDKSYLFEDPLYRKMIGEGSYINLMSKGIFKWMKADLLDITMDGDTAIVRVNLQGQPKLPGISMRNITPVEQMIELKWIRIEGQWYNSLN
jgi:hypothetical protein